MTILFRRGELIALNKAGIIYHTTCGHLDDHYANKPLVETVNEPVVGMVINDIHTSNDTSFESLRSRVKWATNKIALPNGMFTTFPWMIEKLK